MNLRDYQERGADFLFEHDRALVLAPVGAGKTALTLTAMQDMLDAGAVKRWLVLAPKRVCEAVWPVEAGAWAPKLKVQVAVGAPKKRTAALESDADVVVTNYDNLQWLADQDISSFDAVVFDELTKLKNPSGRRFKALSKVLKCPIRWGLTGSFTSNGLEDVFGQCKIVDQSLLGRSKGAFLQQYFFCVDKDFNRWEPRAGALPIVMEKIKPATFLLSPGNYANKLPPCHVVKIRPALKTREFYDQMKQDFIAQFPTAQAVAANAGVMTQKLQQMASGFVYTPEAVWFSDHKFDALDDLLSENQRANTLLVYQFQEELEELKRRYPHLVTLEDRTAIDRWNAGKVELLAIHPKSAGHGLNLQHGGSHMVFLSLPWSLELYEQTVGRLHRSGQANDVWVYVFLTEETIDEQIWSVLHDKQTLSDAVMKELR